MSAEWRSNGDIYLARSAPAWFSIWRDAPAISLSGAERKGHDS